MFNDTKTNHIIHKIFERSFNNGNYEYPINIIVAAQFACNIPPIIRKYCNITIIGKTNSETYNAKLAPSISKQQFGNMNNSLNGYDRIQVNNVQKAAIIHKSNATHISSKL